MPGDPLLAAGGLRPDGPPAPEPGPGGEVRFDLLIPAETEAVLLVEFEGDDPQEIREQMPAGRRGLQPLAAGLRHPAGVRPGGDGPVLAVARPGPAAVLPREGAEPAGAGGRRRGGSARGPARFPRADAERAQAAPGDASLLCHAGHGQLHIQPFLDLDDPDDVQRMRLLADDLYQEVFAAGGTIGGEHAYGLSRTSFLERQAGPLYEVFCQVKQIFDPEQHFQSRARSSATIPELMTRNLRRRSPRGRRPRRRPEATADGEAPALRDMVELQLNWDPSRVAAATAACNRCGECRTQAPRVRMCPIFRFAPAEEASPRAKANLIRGILSRSVDLSRLTSDEFKEVADLCVHCHSCRLECPAGVDIPRLMMESKGAYVAANGLRLGDWVMTRLDLLAALGSRMPAGQLALGNRQMRWLLEKTLGIAQGRKLPRVASRSFLRRAARRRLTRPSRRSGHKVLYFVDTFANYHDPQLAEAFVAVLKHNGISVYVHPDQRPAAWRRSPAGRWTMPGDLPGTTSPCWPRPSGRATTSWRRSRPPRCA